MSYSLRHRIDAPLDRRHALALGILQLEPRKDVVHVLPIDFGLSSQRPLYAHSAIALTFFIKGKVTPWFSYA